MKGFFLNKQAQLKALVQKPSEVIAEEETAELSPWYAGMNKRQEEKSERIHQEQVRRYHQIHDLAAKKVDTANIARQVGVSRRTVYYYLKMTEPPPRTRINRQERSTPFLSTVWKRFPHDEINVITVCESLLWWK